MQLKFNLKQRGFSIMEFAIVVVILGILAAVTSAIYPGKVPQLRGQARQLVSDIRYMQYYAMSHHVRAKIDFSSSNQYTLYDLTNAQSIVHPATNNTTVDVGAGGFSLSLSGDDGFTTNKVLVFDSLGRPYSNESVPGTALVDDAVITLTTGDNSMGVTVIPETGQANPS
jgi:prepilin-type N-terminal cleavage/methylation domain-containing protein